MPPLNLMIVDERTLERECLALALSSGHEGIQVAQASDGITACKGITDAKPQLVVSSLTIPDMCGLELIRKMSKSLPIRVIALAETKDPRLAAEALQAGAKAVLLRSDSLRFLRDAIKIALEGGIYISASIPVSLSRHDTRADPDADPIESLSTREYQVFRFLVGGCRPKEIAYRLSLSPKTIDTYRAHLMKKLRIFDIPGLVKLALGRGVIPMN